MIERDPVLADRLRNRFGAIEVVAGDAAAHTWPVTAFSVVANLPFARSGAILAHLLRDPGLPLRGAEGDRAVGVRRQARCGVARDPPLDLLACVVRPLHRPPPRPHGVRAAARVDAAVLRLTRRDRPRVPAGLHEDYWAFLSAAFALRSPVRSGLRPALSPLQVKRLAPVLGFGPDARARDVDAEQWPRLFAAARGAEAK